MRLSYRQALDSIIEHTEIGYTIASQDRLWIVFTFDLWSEDEHISLRYNRLYPRGLDGGMAYDLDMTGVMVWTTRAEAEAFAAGWRERLAEADRAQDDKVKSSEHVYVMNLGDDARFEAGVIGRYGVTVRTTPKFKGSESAWQAMVDMHERWRTEIAPLCP